MQTLSVAEYGLYYMQKCLQYYSENCAYFLFYVAALLFIICKGTTREKQIFVPSAVLMLLTVFNPVFPVVINHFFDINKEYYRFFWIPPIVILVSFVAARLMEYRKRAGKAVVVLLVLVLLISGGNYVYQTGYIKSPNIYKMPTEIPTVSQMIHEDSAVEYPRAVFEYDFNMLMRQYDATILLSVDREAYLNAVSGALTMEAILSPDNYVNRLLAVVALNIEISPGEFRKGLDETETEYVVVSTVSPITEYLEECGLRLVGMTENHSVYHYELANPPTYPVQDYTDIWENF